MRSKGKGVGSRLSKHGGISYYGRSTPSHLEDSISNEFVSAATCVMEVDTTGKAQEQAVATIGRGDGESRMLQQRRNT